jgi:hypothetical protein
MMTLRADGVRARSVLQRSATRSSTSDLAPKGSRDPLDPTAFQTPGNYGLG